LYPVFRRQKGVVLLEWVTRISWADLLVIIIILRSTYVGSQRGLFGELFHILGICLAIVFGIHFYTIISGFINTYLFIPLNIADIIGFLIITLVIYLLLKLCYGLLQKIIKIEMFPAINRVGGPILGFCKGVTLSVLIFFFMLLTPVQYISDSAKTRSLFAPFFVNAGITLYEKSAEMFPAVQAKELKKLLSGAEPLKLDILRIKRKDKLDQILQ